MNIVVTGFAGHGKDTACQILNDTFGFTFESSSRAALKEVIYPALKDLYGYTSEEECFQDRVNHRKEWFNLIAEYNKDDLTKLGKLIFSKSQIYCGLRNIMELTALKHAGLVDLVIWVDARIRLHTLESYESITINPGDADIIVDNNGTEVDLANNLDKIFRGIKIL